MKLWSIVLAGILALGMGEADAAKRLGGGKSTGQQSTQVTKREAANPPASPAAPAATPAQAQPSPAAAAPAQAAKRPWGAMLGGLAAGLGLAWLASSLGLGAEFGQFLLIALLVLVGFMLFAAYKRSRQNAEGSGTTVRSPYALQSAGNAPSASTEASASKVYNPAKIGNDASARPWEQQGLSAPSGTGSSSMIGSALRPSSDSQAWSIPADFDVAGFVDAAKRNFVTLQAAWDRSDIATLRSMMTDDMLREIRSQLDEREKMSANAASQTDVMMLNAQLLGIEDLGSHHMASVEFSGMIREDMAAGPAPFREVWNMTKPKSGGSGWLVAGLQALE